VLIEVPRNRRSIEDRIKDTVESDDDSIYLLVCAGGDPVGGVSLRDVRQEHGMLVYWLLPEGRGQGFATEGAALLLDHAFGKVGLHRVYAWTIDDNEASQRVLRRLGFTHEGTYREHVYTRSAYHDTEQYGLLEREWDGVDAVLNGR
jgi:RimJ/RimL family protein N-acetyltransferase